MYEAELEAYFRRVEKHLPCEKPRREKLREYLQKQVADTLADQPGLAFAEVAELLGTPEDTAADYMSTLPPGTAEAWEKKHRRRNLLLGGAIALCLAVLAGLVIYYYAIKGVMIVETKKTIISYGNTDLTDEQLLESEMKRIEQEVTNNE